MTLKNDTNVLIGGNVYTLSGDESAEYIQRVALYINNKLDEIKNSDNAKRLNTRLVSVLLDINIADDYFKAKEKIEEQEHQIKKKDERLKTVEHEVANLQRKIDEMNYEKSKFNERIEVLKTEIKTYKEELDEYIELFDSQKTEN